MKVKNRLGPVSKQKRHNIIKQAGLLFMKKGFGAISMDEIAKMAEVSKRTLYNHFPTKKILFGEIVRMEWQKVNYPKIHDSQINDPREMFTAIMKQLLKIMYSVRMQNLLKLVLAESAKFPELKKLQAEYGAEPLLNTFIAYINYLCKKDLLCIDDAKIAALQYLGLVKECLYWPWLFGGMAKPSKEEQEDIIRRANDVFFGYYLKP